MADLEVSPARSGTDPRARTPRVLIVRLGAMGDVIHALPAVAMLRQALAEGNASNPGKPTAGLPAPSLPAAGAWRIGWVIERRWQELLCAPGTALAGEPCEGRPLVDEVHLVDTRAWRKRPLSPGVAREFLSAIGRLRDGRYAAALDLQGAIKSALLARLSGAKLVAGFRQPREDLARRLYGQLIAGRAAHVIDQNCELVQAWLEQCGILPPRVSAAARNLGHPALSPDSLQPAVRSNLLPRHPASEATIARKLEAMGLANAPLAILNPGAGWAAKQWAPARYGALALALAARGVRSVINYGPGEDILASEAAVFSRGAAEPLSTTLSEFIALARRARLFVGGDTGPMHLAALLGVPTLALFGPTDPARNGPYWPGTRVLRDAASTTSYSHSRTSDPGLEKLSVERVLAEAEALLHPSKCVLDGDPGTVAPDPK